MRAVPPVGEGGPAGVAPLQAMAKVTRGNRAPGERTKCCARECSLSGIIVVCDKKNVIFDNFLSLKFGHIKKKLYLCGGFKTP